MDDLFEDFTAMAVLLFFAFGAVVMVVVIAVTLFLFLLPYILMALAVAGVCYGLFKLAQWGWNEFVAWRWRVFNSPERVAQRIEATFQGAKSEMEFFVREAS